MTLDPYRTLGIAPGASAADIKRAYRTLVKEHHPDSGGPAELPRFLAIQAAYETLTSGRALGPGSGSRARPAGAGGAGTGAAGTTGTGPAWRADPSRARATREAWRRSGRGRSTGEPADDVGAGPAGDPSDPAGPASRRGRRAAGGADAGSGPAGGHAGAGERHREGGRPGRGSRRKATPGSTTYDEAHHEPDEPGWTGSSWYGQASGTYWTINPREYADPRKHGPEYLARARKAAQAGGAGSEDAGMPGFPGAGATREPPATDAPRGTSMRREPASPSGSGGEAQRGRGERPAAEGAEVGGPRSTVHERGAPAGGATWVPGDRRPGDRPEPRTRPAGTSAGRRAGATAPPVGAAEPPFGAAVNLAGGAAEPPFGAAVDLAGAVDGILRAPARPRVRLLLALAAWPPLGIAAALLLGELTGCARFAASCAGTTSFSAAVLGAQAVILALLLAVPPLARLTAVGSLAAVVAALPAMAFLTAIGAPYSPQGGPASLLALLGVAWLCGVVLAGRSQRARRARGAAPTGGAP